MSNRFSCSCNGPDFSTGFTLFEPYLTQTRARGDVYNFFSCAYPLVTSAAIKDVTVNSRFYYVKRLKLDFFYSYRLSLSGGTSKNYMMVYVLNIPQDYDYTYGFVNSYRLSSLFNHKIPENVLYYDVVTLDRVITTDYVYHSKNIHIDITKPFKVLPSYKLAFCMVCFCGYGPTILNRECSVEVFFDVN